MAGKAAVKKYHFLLYISEEQEQGVRQLFQLNKWVLHCQVLAQLADILKRVENEMPEAPYGSRNRQQRHCRLSAHNDSGRSTAHHSSSDFINEERSMLDLAAQVLSRGMKEIEKETKQDEIRPGSIEVSRTEDVPPFQEDQPLDGGRITPISVRNFNVSSSETTAVDLNLNEMQLTNSGETVVSSDNASSLGISACESNRMHMCTPSYREHFSELDTLARASEIAGIPYQQPEGTLCLISDYNKVEHVYQLPSTTHQPEIHNNASEQIFRASAIVPPHDFEHYSPVSEVIQKYHTTSILSSLPNQDNNTKALDIIVNPSDNVYSTNACDDKHEQSQSASSENIMQGIINPLSNKINNLEKVNVASTAMIEKESSLVCDKTVNYSGNLTESDIVIDNSSDLEKQCLTNLQAKTQRGLGNFDTVKARSEYSSNTDYMELEINGSILKIPVLKQRENESAYTDYKCNSDENETAEFTANDSKTDEKGNELDQIETSQNDIPDKTNLNSEQTQKESTKDKEMSDSQKVDSEPGYQDNKMNQKKAQNMSDSDKVMKEQLESTYSAKNENEINKEKKKIFNHKHKEKLSQSLSEESKQKLEMDNDRMMSRGVKNYLTRLKAKKEILTKGKMKDPSRKRTKTSAPLKNDENSKRSKTNKERKQTSKDRNSVNTANKDTEKENTLKRKRINQVNSELAGNKKHCKTNKVGAPSKRCAIKRELISDANELEAEHTASDLEKVNIKTEVKIDASNSKPKKLKKRLKKMKKSEGDEENVYDDKIIIPENYTKCVKCGKRYLKDGYCKVCMVECPWCSILLSKSDGELCRTHLRNHRQNDDPRPFQCGECEMKFTSKFFLNRHMKKHYEEGIGPHICEICEKRFTTKYSLKGHIQHMHGDRKRDVQCDLCGNFFLSEGYLRQHRQYVHQEERNFTCELCDVSVKTEALLKRHMARHTNVKNEVCQVCGRSFRVRSDLLRHMVRHDSSKRTFKCEQCGKAFFEDQKLKQHRRIHTGDKPFKCHLCTYKCAVKGNLTKHLKTHESRGDGYSGRAYRRKERRDNVVTEHIHAPDEGAVQMDAGAVQMDESAVHEGAVQMQIEVITIEQIEQGVEQYGADEHGLVHYGTANHELTHYDVCKQNLPHYETKKSEMLQYDPSKHEVPHFGREKQDTPHFDKQELPCYEVPYDRTSDQLERETDQFEAVRTEPVRTEPNPLRLYYETAHPSHMEAGRTTYLEQGEIKEYKESAEGEPYLNQLDMAMIASNYRNTHVNKVDFYNI